MGYARPGVAHCLTDFSVFALALLILIALSPRPVVYPVTPAFSPPPSVGVMQPRLKPPPPPLSAQRNCEKESIHCKD